MNERIKQLAMDAGFYYKITDEIVITPEAGSAGDLNLFAKLIVKECAQLVDDHDPTGIIEGIVLQHFGVVE
jgi:hypothetical protein